MPKQIIPWKEFEIKNFKGIAASTVTPEINACTECENLDPRNDLVSLRTRLGYTLKYAAPTNARMTGTTYLGSENFYVSHIDGDVSKAKEVTCYVNRGALASSGLTSVNKPIVDISKANPCVVELNTSGITSGSLVSFSGITGMDELDGNYYYAEVIDSQSLYLCTDPNNLASTRIDSSGYTAYTIGGTMTVNPKPANINMINVWVRYYWNGTAWVNAWQWLNEAYLVKIYSEDTNAYIKTINVYDTSLINYFNGWTVYNITRDETAVVVKSYDATTRVGIKLSNSFNDWSPGDDLLFMRNYFPYTELVAMGTTATAQDVMFYKVLDDLRITCGGKKDYHVIAVGYRKRHFRFGGYDFGDSDYVDSSLFDINGIVMTPYNICPISGYMLDLQGISDPDGVAAGTYYFKLVGVLDNSSEILLSDNEITVNNTQIISVIPRIKIGSHNLRLTSFDIYHSNDKKNYFYLCTIPLYDNVDNGQNEYIIEGDGYATYKLGEELHTEQNAVLIANPSDYNATTGWTTESGDAAKTTLESATSVGALVPSNGTYFFKATSLTSSIVNYLFGIKYAFVWKPDAKYQIKFSFFGGDLRDYNVMIGNTSMPGTYATFKFPSGTSTWIDIDITLTAPSAGYLTAANEFIRIYQAYNTASAGHYFAIDKFSIKLAESDFQLTKDSPSEEYIQNNMGYPPTYDMVKSWDNSLVSGGKVWVINPYVETRYENKIFFSLFSGSGAFMWDVITGDEYLEMENYDGNNIEAVTILPNLDFLLLRKNSTERRDSQIGTTREILFGNGIIAKKSAVNFGDKVIWCSKDDIVLSNGNQVNLISDGTIRGEYRDITDKTVIASIREDKESSYRMTTGTKEYVFTKVGWITEQRGNPPIHYLSSVDNKLIYAGLNGTSTDIFEETTNASDWNGDSIAFKWKSVPIDINLLGETITGNQRLYLRSIWLNYNAYKADCNVKVYLDNSTKSYPETGIPFTMGALPNYQTKKLPVGAFCRRFQLEISGYDYSGMGFEILSIGFMLKIIGIGKHDGR